MDEIRSLRSEISELQSSSSSLNREKSQLAQTEKTLRSEINTLRSENKRYQTQLEEIAAKLNLETDSKSQLGEKVDNLSQEVGEVSRERDALSGQVRTLTDDLSDAKDEIKGLNLDLQSSNRQVKKLRSDLNALTSNRNSLESTFIRTKNAKESLELARKLEDALDVRPYEQEVSGKTSRTSEIWLQGHKIGQIEVQVPEEIDQPLSVKFRVDSPDTVQFDEETRNLYQSIGDSFRLHPEWDPWSEELEMSLLEGEDIQAIGPREEGVWSWKIQGEPEAPGYVSFVAHLINEDDHPVFLCRQDFRVSSSSLFSSLSSSFSISSMIIGLLIGFVGIGAVVILRSNKTGNDNQKRRVSHKQIRKEM
jgi:FtsZ-binding cell division protein ZapB